MVLFSMVTVPPKFPTPPPLIEVLPVMVLFSMVTVPLRPRQRLQLRVGCRKARQQLCLLAQQGGALAGLLARRRQVGAPRRPHAGREGRERDWGYHRDLLPGC